MLKKQFGSLTVRMPMGSRFISLLCLPVHCPALHDAIPSTPHSSRLEACSTESPQHQRKYLARLHRSVSGDRMSQSLHLIISIATCRARDPGAQCREETEAAG